MAAVESHSVLLRRLWAGTWDAAKFAAERPLHRPAFALSACAAQLELAAQGVVRLREAIGSTAEVMELLPLEGRSCSLLERAVDGQPGLPSPVEDPAGFVRALVHAALQTGDGGYGFGLGGAAAVDDLIRQHCGDLLVAAGSLLDPAAAAMELEGAAAELSGAVQGLLAGGLQPPSKEQAVELSAKVVQLGRELRELAARVREVAAPRTPDTEPSAETAASGPGSSVYIEDSAASSSPPVFEEVDESEGDAMHDETAPGAAADQGGEAEEGDALQRTKSQVVKRIKVDEVAKALEARREPVEQLRKVLSQLDGGKPKQSGDSGGGVLRYERTADELQQVQKLQQSFRNFGEDLMEGMLTLDQLSGLAEPDRQVRKDTLRGIQGLLDEIDAAKPRVAKMQKKLAEELQQLRPPTSEEPPAEEQAEDVMMGVEEEHPPQQQQQQQQQQRPEQQRPPRAPKAQKPSAPLAAPQVDWTRLKLPLKFSSDERPRAYLLSASAAGLDPDSIRLSRHEGGVLRVQGTRLPSATEHRALLRLLSEHVQRMPKGQRQRLTQEDVDEMLLQLGHGRFGRFAQDFELPRDVNWSAIEPSYEDGVLRVVLPRLVPQGYARPGGWMQGVPNDFLW